MAKNEATIVLKQAVVLGVGDKAKTFTAGSLVKVTDEMATQLIEARAALLAELPPTVVDPATGD